MSDYYNYWISARLWMYNRIDPYTGNFTEEFRVGVEGFLEFAGNQSIALENRGKFYCPCSKCNCEVLLTGRKISNHILGHGFMPGYHVWYRHGEELNVDLGCSSNTGGGNYNDNVGSSSQNYQEQVPIMPSEAVFDGDRCVEMVNDAFYATMNPETIFHDEEGYQQNASGPNAEAKNLYDMLEDARNPLYDGCCDGHSKLSAASRMMGIKGRNDISQSCMDEWTDFISQIFPEGNSAVGSYYELEKIMRKMGLPIHAIDVCPANCMIFWKEDERWTECGFCGHPRWKTSQGRTKIPFSRMWYLPIGARLKKLYQSDKTASFMRWHAEHESQEGEMCHPSDAAEWKQFNREHPAFANETRNVYLGLCTDGFNPFGMSKNHSLWHVILTPYNLPPGMCMKREYLFLTITNSGPNHPRGSLDIFLRPLIDELKDLWSTGIEAYDKSTNEIFNLKAVLLWTISDFPAYGMLSGWTTHGKLSCPICMDDTRSFSLPHGNKVCWFDCHRRFLREDHPLRNNRKNFIAKTDAIGLLPALTLSGEEVYYERLKNINPPKTSDVGGNGHEAKMPGYGKRITGTKKHILGTTILERSQSTTQP